MIWALLPLLLLALIFGFTAIERDLSTELPPAAPSQINSLTAEAAAQEFMLYRGAVLAYAAAHFGTGSYPSMPASASALGLSNAAVSALPADAFYILALPTITNNVAPSDEAVANKGYYVCTWMKVPPGTVTQAVNMLGGDLTIGTVVSSSSWLQAGPNGKLLPIPSMCFMGENPVTLMPVTPPVGDMISVVGMTENAPVTVGGS